jgi:hypothetical protein
MKSNHHELIIETHDLGKVATPKWIIIIIGLVLDMCLKFLTYIYFLFFL